MFTVQKALEGIIVDLGNQVSAPVAKLTEHLFCHVAVAIEIGIAQTSQNLVLTIERHPTPVALYAREVALIEFLPRIVDGLTANEAVETFLVVVILILTVFHDFQHIVHALLELRSNGLIMAGRIGQCQSREIVTANMSTEVEAIAAPVLEVGVLGEPLVVRTGLVLRVGQTGLTYIGREQTVNVVLEQHLDVEIHGRLHRAIQEGDLFQVEMLGIEF